MAPAYATADQLVDWLPADAVVDEDDAGRVLTRASELLDDHVTAGFRVTNGLPADTTLATAMAEACCAQVEFWTEVGEEHDIAGLAGRQVSIGQLSLSALPPKLAPRAARILRTAGLLTPGPGPVLLPEELP